MVEGVDCAFPQSSYPSWAKIVAGYAGGHTQHQWTPSEVQAVRNSGRKWLAIWTGVNLSPLTLNATLGHQDAAGMIARLPVYNYSKQDAVLYDIEPGVYDRNPAGAEAAIAAWKADMHAAGYPFAYVYTVQRQGGDWIANWTNVKPQSIPAGKVGVQYGGDIGNFDYNVFIDSFLTGGDPVPALDATDLANIKVQCLAAVRQVLTVSDTIAIVQQGQANNDNVFGIIDSEIDAVKADTAAIKSQLTTVANTVSGTATNVTTVLNNTNAIITTLNAIKTNTATSLDNEAAILAAIAALPTSGWEPTPDELAAMAEAISSDLHVDIPVDDIATAVRHDFATHLGTDTP